MADQIQMASDSDQRDGGGRADTAALGVVVVGGAPAGGRIMFHRSDRRRSPFGSVGRRSDRLASSLEARLGRRRRWCSGAGVIVRAAAA